MLSDCIRLNLSINDLFVATYPCLAGTCQWHGWVYFRHSWDMDSILLNSFHLLLLQSMKKLFLSIFRHPMRYHFTLPSFCVNSKNLLDAVFCWIHPNSESLNNLMIYPLRAFCFCFHFWLSILTSPALEAWEFPLPHETPSPAILLSSELLQPKTWHKLKLLVSSCSGGQFASMQFSSFELNRLSSAFFLKKAKVLVLPSWDAFSSSGLVVLW